MQTLPYRVASSPVTSRVHHAYSAVTSVMALIDSTADNKYTKSCTQSFYLSLTFIFQGSILDVIKNIEYCDILNDEAMITEHLRLLVNLSATNIAHDEIMTGLQDFFNILSQSLSGKIQVRIKWIVTCRSTVFLLKYLGYQCCILEHTFI